ncbi:MAG: mechanosensitive ion channel family protein [Halobacteriaceae archaeon]
MGARTGIVEALARWAETTTGRVLLSVAAVLGAYLLGRLIVRLLGRRVARRFERPSITRAVLRAIRVSLFIGGLFIAARILGLQLTQIALSVTVFSAVLGLVLAPIVGSVISGLFILADQPYEIGDMIEIVDTGRTGFVEDIALRYTKIFTLDNTFLVVPNGEMRSRDVINYSAEDERTRLSLDILVTYEGDLGEARQLVEEAAEEVDQVIGGGPDIRIGSARYPAAPTCYIETYGDHGVNLRLRYWARKPYKLLATRSAVQERVWDRLEAADGVTIAYPHTHHVFDDTSGTARVEMNRGGRPAEDSVEERSIGGDPGPDRDSEH